MSSVWGTSNKAKFFSYNFRCNQNKLLQELLLGFLQLLSSVVVITADKKETAPESAFAFEEKYGAI
jgi:hypothetical protein